MRLIYNCGRLRGTGYATFLGNGGKAGSSDPSVEQLWQAVQRGAPRPGTTGIMRRLASEGREIVEVLVLDHGRSLTTAQTAAIEAALGSIFDRDIKTALQAANSPNVGLPAAQAMMGEALNAALPVLTRQIPSSARKIITTQSNPPARKRRKGVIAIAGTGGVLLLLGGMLALRWPTEPEAEKAKAEIAAPEPAVVSAETTETIKDFLYACYGVPDPAVVEPLASAFSQLAPTKATDGRRDRLQLIAEPDRNSLAPLSDRDDKSVCTERQALWQAIDALRPYIGRAEPMPYADVTSKLGDHARSLVLLDVATSVSQFAPPPSAPPDCAAGKCFPILHPADAAAIRWIDDLHKAMLSVLAAGPDVTKPEGVSVGSIESNAEALRAAEVQFRGELALAGIAMNQPNWLKQVWNCEGADHLTTCGFPLAKASAWARRQP
jgi:hypothetical protein